MLDCFLNEIVGVFYHLYSLATILRNHCVKICVSLRVWVLLGTFRFLG